MSLICVNINWSARVRLTARGRKILNQKQAQLAQTCSALRTYLIDLFAPDADGWSHCPLWEVMQIFGADCAMGPEPPFETQFLIEQPDKQEAAQAEKR